MSTKLEGQIVVRSSTKMVRDWRRTWASLASLSGLLVWGGVSAVQAQGTVNFVNRITGTLDAPVYYGIGGPLAKGGGVTEESACVAQLYMVSGGSTGPVGDPIPFRNSASGAGYWVGAARTLPGVAEGAQVQLKVVAWTTVLGATYEAARASGVGYGAGESPVFTVTTGGGLNPPTPLVGLQSFVIYDMPEPSSWVLLLLGGVLMRKRRPAVR